MSLMILTILIPMIATDEVIVAIYLPQVVTFSNTEFTSKRQDMFWVVRDT